MDHNSIRNIIVGTPASVLAFGALLIQTLKSKKQIARKCIVNRDYERENYINSILYRDDHNCTNIIRMPPIAFFM
ncbi:hypothetical protein GQ457_08G024070 [Hibiscus cannabinus]